MAVGATRVDGGEPPEAPPPPGRAENGREHTGETRLIAQAGINILRLGQQGTTPPFLARRNETAEFLDSTSARRSVECHLWLSGFSGQEAWPLIAGELYVPLARLHREDGTHTTFKVVDESGAKLPRLSKSEERDLVLAGVVQVASEVLGHWPDDKTIALLGTIIYGHCHHNSLGLQQNPDCRGLASSEEFMAVLIEAYSRFYLIVPLAPGSDYARRVITYTYDEQPTLDPKRGTWVADIFWPRPIVIADFEVPAVADTRSFHFELTAPDDVAIPAGCGTLEIERPVRHGGPTTVVDNDRSDRRAHFYYDGGGPVSKSVIHAPLRLADTGITLAMRAVTLAASILMAITAGLAWFGHDEVFDLDGIEAWVTVLLVAPALVTAVIAIRSGHGLTSQMSRDSRLTAALPAFGLFIGAVALAARLDIDALRSVLLVGTGASVVACIRLFNERRALRQMMREAS